MADGWVVMVAYTLRRSDDGEKIRLISARRASRRERAGYHARQLIAIRVDAGVLDQFRKEARRRRVGYQTLINEVLAQHVRRDVA